MNRTIVFVALLLCASCAHTPSTSKTEANQLTADILQGDSQHPVCARGETSYCRVTRASHFTAAQSSGTCECVSNSLLKANAATRVTAPSPGTRVR